MKSVSLRSFVSATVVVTMAALAGCTATGCTNDPLTDSLACANQNLRTGVYDRQTATLSNQAASRNDEVADLGAENQRLAGQRAELQKQRKLLQQQAAVLSRELSTLENKVSDLTASGALSPAEAAAYQVQVDNLAARQQAADDESEIASLKQEIDDLKKVIDLF